MADYFDKWGVTEPPQTGGVGPTQSLDDNNFANKWLGVTQEVPPVINAPPSDVSSNIMKVFPFRLIPEAAKAVAGPGNAVKSTWDNPITTEEMIAPATNLAGLIATGPMPSVVRAGESSIPAINSLVQALRPTVKPLI